MTEFTDGDFVCYKDTVVKIVDEGHGLYGMDSSGRVDLMGPGMQLATGPEINKWYHDRYCYRKAEAERLQTAVYRAQRLAAKAYDEWMNYDEQK